MSYIERRFWKWMGRRWRIRESKWTVAAYNASAWDEHGQVSGRHRRLYREAAKRAEDCGRRAARCERRADVRPSVRSTG